MIGVGKTAIELNIAPVCVCELHAILAIIATEWKYPPPVKNTILM